MPGSITAGGPHLTGTEAVMWILDDEPALRSTFISVSLLDRPVDVERLRARMGRAVEEVPVLRRRLAPTPLDLAPPRWEDDPDFDLVRHVRFLRRVPVDPMTGHAEWGMRSVQDDPDSTSWGGKNVFDVFSLASGTALDGTKYGDW